MLKGKFYRTNIRLAMLNDMECWATKKKHASEMSVAEENVKIDVWLTGETL